MRRWTCVGCGAERDRDHNAALNIARLGCETPRPPRHGSPAFQGGETSRFVQMTDRSGTAQEKRA
ncbi:zinc ribbon domain-containing protein [uncultured Methylobacterium sp.]|uniref:zinc ribbon domain-containing protein n=1 Tax=uncultured Methylobacterium sp. TaxID=157278 RepID=UPI00338EC235